MSIGGGRAWRTGEVILSHSLTVQSLSPLYHAPKDVVEQFDLGMPLYVFVYVLTADNQTMKQTFVFLPNNPLPPSLKLFLDHSPSSSSTENTSTRSFPQ